MKARALAIAVVLAVAGPAQAVDTNLGDITGLVSAPAVASVTTPTFLDRYFFQINLLSNTSVTVADFQIQKPDGSFLWNITGLTANLYQDVGTVGSYDAGLDINLVPGGNLGTGDFIQASQNLASGAYFLATNGTVSGSGGGTYLWHITALPIPEPETWAMLLAGIGLVGLRMRRRSASA